jgi:hypothetical protein
MNKKFRVYYSTGESFNEFLKIEEAIEYKQKNNLFSEIEVIESNISEVEYDSIPQNPEEIE